MTTPTTSQQISAFFQAYPIRRYLAGEVIILADTPAPLPVYFIEHGLVGQFDVTTTGNRIICNIFKLGAFFPMSNALNHLPSKHYYEAMEACEVRVAPAEAVIHWLETEPGIALDLLKRVYRGADGLIGRMTQLMAGTARSRVIFELWVMAERFGEPLGDGTSIVRITEAQLAAQTGLARETVSRELAALKREGTVTLARRGITVKMGMLNT